MVASYRPDLVAIVCDKPHRSGPVPTDFGNSGSHGFVLKQGSLELPLRQQVVSQKDVAMGQAWVLHHTQHVRGLHQGNQV